RGHALPLVGHDGGAVHQFRERGLVVEGADHERADRAGGSIRGGIEKAEGEVEGDPGQREHPTELPAAENGDERYGPAAGSVGHGCMLARRKRPSRHDLSAIVPTRPAAPVPPGEDPTGGAQRGPRSRTGHDPLTSSPTPSASSVLSMA